MNKTTAHLAMTLLLLISGNCTLAQTVKPNTALEQQHRNQATALINKDGTVIIGNLQWMRCSTGQHWEGNTCSGKAYKYSLKGALKLPGWINRKDRSGEGGFAGMHDWRLPTIDELATLRRCSSGSARESGGESQTFGRCDGDFTTPAIDTRLFPNTPAIRYWSSSRFFGSPSTYWSVDFSDGAIAGPDGFAYREFAVRLVRDIKNVSAPAGGRPLNKQN